MYFTACIHIELYFISRFFNYKLKYKSIISDELVRNGEKMFSVENMGNKEKILRLLRKKKELTKQDISKEIGVSIPTVISNVNELLSENLVTEAKMADSTGGREPVAVSFLPDSRYVFGVDISPENVRVILTNLDFKIEYEEGFLIASLRNMETIMLRIKKIVDKIIETKKIDVKKILGIGFSLPGTVNEDKFILEVAPNLGIRNVDFKQFGNMFEFPMFIENEANTGAIAELNLGIAKEMKDLVYISVSSGIGTGIVVRDNLYKGKNKRAGEFGHMTLVPGGKPCGCGRLGCWEMYASIKALLEEFNKQSEVHAGDLTSFFDILNSDNKIAKDCFDRYLNALAVGIQNIIIIFDPHYVVIGGEVSEFADYFLENLKGKIFVENSFYTKHDLEIFSSKLKKDSSILGAAIFAAQSIFSISEKII